jgi:hypothetical protein
VSNYPLSVGLICVGFVARYVGDFIIARSQPHSRTPIEESRAKTELIRLKIDTASEELTELERRAGITKAVERANQAVGPLFFGEEIAPYGTVEREQQVEEEIKVGRSYYRGSTRDAYFSVADSGLRYQLIAKECEFDKLISELVANKLGEARANVDEANFELQRAREALRAPSYGVYLPASIHCIILVYAGSWFFQLAGIESPVVGAIAGGIIAFFNWHRMEREAKSERVSATRYALQRFTEAERDFESESHSDEPEPPLFSPTELTEARIAAGCREDSPPSHEPSGPGMGRLLRGWGPRDREFWIFNTCIFAAFILIVLVGLILR